LVKKRFLKAKTSFEADFEYGTQPMRWEAYTIGGASLIAQEAMS